MINATGISDGDFIVCQAGLFENVVKHCSEADTCTEKLGLYCFCPVACVVVAEFEPTGVAS